MTIAMDGGSVTVSKLITELLEWSGPLTIALASVTIAVTRSLHAVYVCLGAVFCTLLAKLLKRLLRIQRPSSSTEVDETYGMPSSHAQAIMFFWSYLVTMLTTMQIEHALVKYGLIYVISVYAWSVMTSRVNLGHHTLPQVAVGAGIGIAFGIIWFGGRREWGGIMAQYACDIALVRSATDCSSIRW
ncbi:PAP2-domain-containing protein [Ramicandelaber brevisporus]|nr:PAP2-domain-containing protein [Ramicandelaber brevisporus]